MADSKYRINLNRMKTTKWAQAQPVDYGGDDWGEDEYDNYEPEPTHLSQPLSAPHSGQAQWEQPIVNPGRRSFTNPVQPTHGRDLSFDGPDDRRHVSGGYAGGFEPEQSRSFIQPGSSLHGAIESIPKQYREQPSLQLNTQVSGTGPLSAGPGRRAGPFSQTTAAPLSAPGAYTTNQTNISNTISSAGNLGQAAEKRRSYDSAAAQPPFRSGSVTQDTPTDFPAFAQSGSPSTTMKQNPGLNAKPLPFIRPADIYKRVEEEREKERRSQESSRPSIDSATGAPKDFQTPVIPTATKDIGSTPVQDGAKQSQPLKKLTTLVEGDSPSHSSSSKQLSPEQQHNATMVSRQASSVYSNRRDPVSASSTDSPPLSLPTLTEVQTPSSAKPPFSAQEFPAVSTATTSSATPLNNVEDVASEELPHFERGIAPPADTKPDDKAATFTDQLKQDLSKDDPARLQHTSSVEHTSAGYQASDRENEDVLSPVTTSDSMLRSNSASTSGISPIITDRYNSTLGTSHHLGTHQHTDSEIATSTRGRPESTATLRPGQTETAREALELSNVVPSFRRSSKPPSPSSSPARKPLNLVTPQLPAFEQGIVSDANTASATEDSDQHTTPIIGQQSRFDKHPAAAPEETTSQALNRTTSEDWQDWKAQRRSFHAQVGLEDSNSTTPAISSPVSRSQTPAKGTVREIADRLESQSGRSTPVNTTSEAASQGSSRPLHQNRLESFRPSLPGGWESDTTTASLKNFREDVAKPPRPPFIPEQNRTISTESIPTATAPKGWHQPTSGPIDMAFAAAAAAGTAMAGAFSGRAFTRDTDDESDTDSENEAYPGHPDNQHPNLRTRDFAVGTTTHNQSQNVDSTTSGVRSASPSRTTSTDQTPSERNTPVDFPAPLRMNKQNDNSPISTRFSIFSPPVASPNEDNEQLQKEIVQSLTPKTSNVAEPSVSGALQRDHVPGETSLRRQSSETADDDVLPEEYASYWDDKSHKSTTTSKETPSALKAAPILPLQASSKGTSELTDTNKRPILEQRFSWEDTPQPQTLHGSRQETAVESVVKESPTVENPILASKRSTSPVLTTVGTTADRPITPTQPIVPTTSAFDTSTTETTDSPDRGALHETPTMSQSRITTQTDHLASFPQEKIDFRTILGYGDSTRRIRAFDDNRRLYAEPNGLLDSWLASLNLPEHADVFITSRQHRTQSPTARTDRPMAPRRDLQSGSGTKQMQEDGKRLLAVAGKIGGKAGVAAKGLFAKGKDRLRTASAGDKGALTSRRRSAASEVVRPTSPEFQHSTLPATAPQLPPPSLQTPTEEVSWSLISSTIDQIFSSDAAPQVKDDSNPSQRLSQLGARGEPTKWTNDRASLGEILEHPLPSQTAPTTSTVHQEVTAVEHPASHVVPQQEQDQVEHDRLSTPVRRSTGDDHNRMSVQRLQATTAEHTKDKSQPELLQKGESGTSISDVSEISQNHVLDDGRNNTTRNVSPPPDELSQSRSQEVPIFLSHDLSKEAEARREREFMESAPGHGSLPPYTSSADRLSQIRIPPGAEIVPVGVLGSARNSERRTSNRPFSFMENGTMSSAPSYHHGGSPPPISPNDRSQRRSRAEKIREPDIMDHPAYRSTDDVDNDDNENPLPSSRRPPDEVSQMRQRTTQTHQSEPVTGAYRIPGPYVQEYRPPKPKPSNEHFQQAQPRTSLDGRHLTDQALVTPSTPLMDALQDNRSVAQSYAGSINQREPRPPINFDQTQTRSFGSLFRSRSGSRRRDEVQEPMEAGISQEDKKKQRRVNFRLNSRTSSPGPYLEDLPEDRVQQPRNLHRRILSTDLLKGKTFGLRSQSEGKKKRSSGFANFFSRSSNKDKSRPSTAMSQRSDMSTPTQQPSILSLRRAANTPEPNNMRSGMRDDQYTKHMQPQMQNSKAEGQSSAYYETRGYYEPSRAKSSQDDVEYDSRPDNLWIDTSNDSRLPHHNLPSTAATPYTATSSAPLNSSSTLPSIYSASPPVPVTRANRDISYGQDRPYVPSVGGPVQGKPQTGMADHVKELHKRSRSPRLGRPASNEMISSQYDGPAHSLQIPDPATVLGTFSNMKASPVGRQRPEEDQEKPWTLTLPGGERGDEDEPTRMDGEHATDTDAHRGRPYGDRADTSAPNSVPVASGQEITRQMTRSPVSEPDHVFDSRQSREARRLLLERAPSPFLAPSQNGDSHTTKPQTVAERFMGIQAQNRSTTPNTSPPTRHTPQMGGIENIQKTDPTQTTVSRGDTVTTSTSTSPDGGIQTSTIVIPANVDTLSLPDRTASRAQSAISQLRVPTPVPQVQTKSIIVNDHPSKTFTYVELPGSKPDGYESEDEPVMSATAYPGQEWMPLYADDGKWDD